MQHINYLYPFWGSETDTIDDFIENIIDQGFNGIEIHIPNAINFENALYNKIENIKKTVPDFIVVPQQVTGVKLEAPEDYLVGVLKRLEELKRFEPNFINSHTGKDHYSFSDNCRIIEAIEAFSLKNKVKVYHEIHRGRFTFHSATTLTYLEQFPQLKLVGDLSHWCVVSESMLEDQASIIKEVIPHIHHIHARVGFEQAPQVNHPFAPEWEPKLKIFLGWWQQIVDHHKKKNNISITPEFGPFPYMPQSPFDQKPLAQQKVLNFEMKIYLQEHLKLHP
ncbi:sugar phosphate isomerase/epimerase [Gelidibacter pelagius]|uniref:Sugar phosphate isomerase/epimerase n=1 Tax=Gelidibacter pelagius TaxID=2819985 RepID=A0ABS3SR32_9FLAO|nr:sugar phosphate isomerase/epimerase [Gelidibacter pelagius]MBO3098154.1 sugar phosphate isomerase/epimerase [Gelidibacter pelagius]